MKPVYLSAENFYCFGQFEIDFSIFNAACVVGRATDNDERANAVGKSKIFAAIEYVLFNESALKNIENVIRDDADGCKVTFIFESDADIWKVVRSRTRKANSADLFLYQKNGDEWDDRTQRKNSETEKDLFNILRMNYKTFENSALFAQGNLEGLPKLTPEKRKVVLRETLQLGVYSKLEATAKKKASDISKEVDKIRAILSTFEGLDEEVLRLQGELVAVESDALLHTDALADRKANYLAHSEALAALVVRIGGYKNVVEGHDTKIKSLSSVLASSTTRKEQLQSKLKSIKVDIEGKIADITAKQTALDSLNATVMPARDDILKKIEAANERLLEVKSAILNDNNRIKELELPLPDGASCNHCRSVLTEEYRAKCKSDIVQELRLIKEQQATAQAYVAQTASSVQVWNQTVRDIDAHANKLAIIQNDIASKKKSIADTRAFFESYKTDLATVKLEVDEAAKLLAAAQEARAAVDTSECEVLERQATDVRALVLTAQVDVNSTEQTINSLLNKKSVLLDRLEKSKLNAERRTDLMLSLKKNEISIGRYNQLAQAFGSKGIPALIIHNMLDDLQLEANSFAAQIKPGLQLKFDIDKENSKGEKTDTLEISYFLNGREREYEQLSGAQKYVVMLSLRLALSIVIQKSFGINIKFLLLDEIDAPLDKESLRLLFDTIKLLEQQFKILLITHNDSLKEKFSHAILVEQDQNLISTAKIVSSW